jgi:hypothetical protein
MHRDYEEIRYNADHYDCLPLGVLLQSGNGFARRSSRRLIREAQRYEIEKLGCCRVDTTTCLLTSRPARISTTTSDLSIYRRYLRDCYKQNTFQRILLDRYYRDPNPPPRLSGSLILVIRIRLGLLPLPLMGLLDGSHLSSIRSVEGVVLRILDCLESPLLFLLLLIILLGHSGGSASLLEVRLGFVRPFLSISVGHLGLPIEKVECAFDQ